MFFRDVENSDYLLATNSSKTNRQFVHEWTNRVLSNRCMHDTIVSILGSATEDTWCTAFQQFPGIRLLWPSVIRTHSYAARSALSLITPYKDHTDRQMTREMALIFCAYMKGLVDQSDLILKSTEMVLATTSLEMGLTKRPKVVTDSRTTGMTMASSDTTTGSESKEEINKSETKGVTTHPSKDTHYKPDSPIYRPTSPQPTAPTGKKQEYISSDIKSSFTPPRHISNGRSRSPLESSPRPSRSSKTVKRHRSPEVRTSSTRRSALRSLSRSPSSVRRQRRRERTTINDNDRNSSRGDDLVRRPRSRSRSPINPRTSRTQRVDGVSSSATVRSYYSKKAPNVYRSERSSSTSRSRSRTPPRLSRRLPSSPRHPKSSRPPPPPPVPSPPQPRLRSRSRTRSRSRSPPPSARSRRGDNVSSMQTQRSSRTVSIKPSLKQHEQPPVNRYAYWPSSSTVSMKSDDMEKLRSTFESLVPRRSDTEAPNSILLELRCSNKAAERLVQRMKDELHDVNIKSIASDNNNDDDQYARYLIRPTSAVLYCIIASLCVYIRVPERDMPAISSRWSHDVLSSLYLKTRCSGIGGSLKCLLLCRPWRTYHWSALFHHLYPYERNRMFPYVCYFLRDRFTSDCRDSDCVAACEYEAKQKTAPPLLVTMSSLEDGEIPELLRKSVPSATTPSVTDGNKSTTTTHVSESKSSDDHSIPETSKTVSVRSTEEVPDNRGDHQPQSAKTLADSILEEDEPLVDFEEE